MEALSAKAAEAKAELERLVDFEHEASRPADAAKVGPRWVGGAAESRERGGGFQKWVSG